MSKILVTRPIPDAGLKMLLAKGHKVDLIAANGPPTPKQLLKSVEGGGYAAILSVLTEKIGADVMAAAGQPLKIIANYAVGFDNIDLAAAKARGIFVTNTPGDEIVETVAELTFALILAVARRVAEADKFTRSGRYRAWDPFFLLGTDVYKKTLGIVGLGRIGSAVVRRAKGFEMKILYNDVRPSLDFEKEFGASFAALPELLGAADFVSLHVPLLPGTRHLIGSPELKLMKKTAYLINTARGPVIEEKALVRALREGVIAGAGLDVYENEPRLAAGLARLENVILTPHVGSASMETRQAMSRVAAVNIIAALSGQVPPNLAK